MIDLQLIAATFEASANQTERCIACHKDAAYVAQKRREITAVRECIAQLRTPGVSHEAALVAITTACGVFA
jgi:hypothetical protein